jgi:hypothetical protein
MSFFTTTSAVQRAIGEQSSPPHVSVEHFGSAFQRFLKWRESAAVFRMPALEALVFISVAKV